MTMKEVSVVIICLLLISVVRGEDITCKAGYGMIPTDIRTSGSASQCSGLSKITTEAECKLAAEYNRKNNIDKNEGYGDRVSASYAPPGCYYYSGIKYFWNPNTKSSIKCSNSRKCICKTKTCIKCPINTYSEGGINPTCTPCPTDRPYTNLNKRDSEDSCKSFSFKEEEIICESGERGVYNDIRKTGTCLEQIATEDECKFAAHLNNISQVDDVNGFGSLEDFNSEKKNSEVLRKWIGNLKDSVKEHADLSIKNSRLWQKEEIRFHHDKMMQNRINNASRAKRRLLSSIETKPRHLLEPNTRFPPGCIHANGKYYFNNKRTGAKCGDDGFKCICKPKSVNICTKCPKNSYSHGGKNSKCIPCPNNGIIKDGVKQDSEAKCEKIYCVSGEEYNLDIQIRESGTCISTLTENECEAEARKITKKMQEKNMADWLEHGSFSAWGGKKTGLEMMQEVAKQLHVQNEKTNDLSIKNSRLWAKEQIRLQHDKLMMEHRTNNDSVKINARSRRLLSAGNAPRGCISYEGRYYYNPSTTSTKLCDNTFRCVCTTSNKCRKCKENFYNDKAGINVQCRKCTAPLKTNADRTVCEDPIFREQLNNFEKKLKKEATNALRLHQNYDINLLYDELMQQRKEKDTADERTFCKKQRDKGTIIFPAIEIKIETEKIEDTTCIDMNRDELLKSFCSFTSDLDNLFQIQNIDKEAKTFWPNICCKERRDKTLAVCKDPTNRVNRTDIIPYALSQGGDYSQHNLYVEVTNAIKQNGYLHKGMTALLQSLKKSVSQTKKINKAVTAFFEDISLCGPRVIDATDSKKKTQLCELFVPYKHAMSQFYNLIESLYMHSIASQATLTSFVETMEASLRKRSEKKRIEKINNMQQVMKAKAVPTTPKAEQHCKIGSKWTSTELIKHKKKFCKGYNHIDLSNTDIKNIAIHYLNKEISYDKDTMLNLKRKLRFDVEDKNCPAAPLFTAEDISLQQVAMDPNSTRTKEWVAVIHLNTEDENSYLQDELPYCKNRNYLIGSYIKVKAYVDDNECCDGLKDYGKCIAVNGCTHDNVKPLKDIHKNKYSKDVELTGTHYVVKSSGDKRRRLLQDRRKGDCRL